MKKFLSFIFVLWLLACSGSAAVTSTYLIDRTGNRFGISQEAGSLITKNYFTDVNNTKFGLTQEAGAIYTNSYLFGIAEGRIPNHSIFTKFGKCAGVQTTAMDVWEGNTTYVFPTGPMSMEVWSTSTQEGASGTGVRKIIIDFLTDTYSASSEEIVLTGTTTVETSNKNILRVNRVYASAVGSSGVSVGTIEVSNKALTVAYAYISPGFTQSRQAIYTVPLGKTLYLTSARYSSGVGNTAGTAKANFVIFTDRATVNPSTGAVSTIMYPYHEIGIENAAFILPLDEPTKIPATSDLKVSVIGDTAQSVTCTVALRGWIE